MTKAGLRRLLIIWWLLGIACVFVTALTRSSLPPELADYVAREANREPTQAEWAVIIGASALLLAIIIGSIGLYFVKSWGRDIFVISNILGLLLSTFPGPLVQSNWASGVCYLYSLVTGGLLFSLYLPPLRNMFSSSGGSGIK